MPFKSKVYNAIQEWYYTSFDKKVVKMVFISKNEIIRKCKHCDLPALKNMSSGRNKGYYRTCGSSICKTQQYKDSHVNKMKGRLVNPINHICAVCDISFKGNSANHKRFCIECVPERSWANRARRYGIGKKQWDELLLKQNNTCALCDKNPETVDHCHDEGIVRGLLCHSCNVSIGRMDKDSIWIHNALKYIGYKNASF
jgi:recombination endonuclease VII